MTTVRFYLCAVPAAWWTGEFPVGDPRATFAAFVDDALSIERRIARGVNLETERTRYGLCCQRIEAAVRTGLDLIEDTAHLAPVLGMGRLPAVELGTEYVDLLERLLFEPRLEERARTARLGTSFYPPDTLGAHIAVFEQLTSGAGVADNSVVSLRLAFLHAAQEQGCGVVEVQNMFGKGVPSRPAARTRVKLPLSIAVPRGAAQEPAVGSFEADRNGPRAARYVSRLGPERESMSLYDILREEIRRAMAEGGGVVNFSNQPPNVVAEVLREFAVAQAGERPAHIRVVYSDGSEAEPFPLRCLPRRAEEAARGLLALRPLRAVLISMRHLDMDALVDMAWFRNVEASRPRAFAETDAFCCEKTVEQLRDVQGNLLLHLYHTGLEPAVVGFYRGLMRVLVEREGAGGEPILAVVPYYYRGPVGYEEGTPWY